ncbi:MAG TPA: undecaprenyldiphospho-muramoylpentapeptide beta-N-acetylglucosaminyltransferase [Deltaproteobacteria bacterium]|nr:undecaprenyldiphospho-muramoylpentapeptide beta-N-acetylglucosaminyltransferase [Deltaproteobacteria bacterium]
MKLLIAAGGTGGHIFPGIAVAEAFQGLDEDNEVLFVGTEYGMEKRIVPATGFRLLMIAGSPFLGTSVVRKAGTILRVLKGVGTAMTIIRNEKPDAVIGMGGFTCVPVMLAALLLKRPAFLHEQNVYPGLANRRFSRYVRAVFTSFDATKAYLKGNLVHTGNPVRKTLRVFTPPVKENGDFGVFIFGGSRGAHAINQAMIALLPQLSDLKDIVLYHQTGTDDYESAIKAYGKSGLTNEVFPFTDRMEKYYGLSDVVIARAGAATIFELAYFNRPAILVPYPFSAGGHQLKNASYVADKGGGVVIENDKLAGGALLETLRVLHDHRERLKSMGQNIGSIYMKDAEEAIAKGIMARVS